MSGWFDIQTVKKMSAGLRESSLILFWTLVLAAVLTRLDGESESFVQWLGRFVYWAAHVGSGLLISVAVMALLQQKFDAARPNLLLIVVTGLIGAVLFTPLALLLDEIESQIWFKSDFDLASLPSALVQEFSERAPIFIGMWLIVQLPLLAATKGTVTPEGSLLSSDSDALPVEPKKDLLSRLPPALGKDVVSVESDLNYVHVTTLQGRTMLLYSCLLYTSDAADD